MFFHLLTARAVILTGLLVLLSAGSIVVATQFYSPKGSNPVHPIHLRDTGGGRHLDDFGAGVNYYAPSDSLTGCQNWTWLRPDCYANVRREDPSISQLRADVSFVSKQHLGKLVRVWISLDQLMKWNKSAGYRGYMPWAFFHVREVLWQFAAHKLKVDLVLLVYANTSGFRYQFHPEALDGSHPAMRTDYLRAVRDFIAFISRSKVATRTVAAIELMTEPYYQLESYFNDPDHLQQYKFCKTGQSVDWGCLDTKIIHPWLTDLYRTARSTSHRFLYTFADTGRLFQDYEYWSRMYPQDVIDEHTYDDYPWKRSDLYARALGWTKPWFVSEAGCASGHIACTYNTGPMSAPDRWWLNNLPNDGARAVLIESHVTVWTYGSGPLRQRLTPTGLAVRAANQTAGL